MDKIIKYIDEVIKNGKEKARLNSELNDLLCRTCKHWSPPRITQYSYGGCVEIRNMIDVEIEEGGVLTYEYFGCRLWESSV